jgi:hypothetical protein
MVLQLVLQSPRGVAKRLESLHDQLPPVEV